METAAAYPSRTSDLLWGSVVSGSYASAATALFFLLVDGAQGQPLFTASLLGSVVLLGQDPMAVDAFRLDMVALYSLVHLAVFVLAGAVTTALYLRWEAIRQPLVLVLLVTASLTAGVLGVDAVLYPGVVARVGIVGIVAGNLAAAAAMAWVLRSGVDTEAAGR